MSLRKSAIAALAAAGMLAAWTAAAQESGTYRSVSSYIHDYVTIYHDYVTIEHEGETFVGGPLYGTMTVVESSGGPFVVGENTVSECLVFSRNRADGLLIEAPCIFQDAADGMLYTYATRKQGTLSVGGGGEGTWELRGGVGRYAGITGTCSYRTEYLAGDRLVVHSDCSWSRS